MTRNTAGRRCTGRRSRKQLTYRFAADGSVSPAPRTPVLLDAPASLGYARREFGTLRTSLLATSKRKRRHGAARAGHQFVAAGR